MAKNEALGRAKDARQDEFYTQLADIENELRHYRPHFKGKTVLCNCDDPYESNFFKYFALNFNKLRLKRLVATCYSGSPITGTQLPLFGDGTEEERRTALQGHRHLGPRHDRRGRHRHAGRGRAVPYRREHHRDA